MSRGGQDIHRRGDYTGLPRVFPVNLWPLFIVAAGFLAYGNSLWGPFVFDDRLHLVDEPTLHQPWLIGRLLMNSFRPVSDFTLAVNYALGGPNAFGYHLVNVAIHLTAACVLFGVLRRTFLSYRLKERYGKGASSLAGAVALLWVVHPLNTQAVTYVIQRAESLMSLFYLSTLYCVIRAATGPKNTFWRTGAILCCGLGLGTKTVMVTAPLMVFLYDRLFLAGSWKESLRQRGALYLGLLFSYMVLLWTWVPFSRTNEISVGFQVPGITPLSYLLTQFTVIPHYLKLSFWPQPLVFDYNWPVLREAGAALLPGLVVGSLVGSTLFALRRGWPAGFLGAWFFGILIPTSSFFPLADCAFEHRMYLPLTAVGVGVVVAGYEVLKRVFGSWGMPARAVAVGMLLLGTGVFSGMTIRRHLDYKSEVILWQDTIRKRPENWRAHHNLGRALEREKRLEEAVPSYRQATRIKPDFVQAYNSLGAVLAQQGKKEEAIESYRRALGIDPNVASVHNNLGAVLGQMGRVEEASKEFEEAIRIEPDNANYRRNLATALEMLGKRQGESH